MVEIKYLLPRHVDCNNHRGIRNRCIYIIIIINLNKQSLWNQDKNKQDKINHKTEKPKKASAHSQSRHLHHFLDSSPHIPLEYFFIFWEIWKKENTFTIT